MSEYKISDELMKSVLLTLQELKYKEVSAIMNALIKIIQTPNLPQKEAEKNIGVPYNP